MLMVYLPLTQGLLKKHKKGNDYYTSSVVLAQLVGCSRHTIHSIKIDLSYMLEAFGYELQIRTGNNNNGYRVVKYDELEE